MFNYVYFQLLKSRKDFVEPWLASRGNHRLDSCCGHANARASAFTGICGIRTSVRALRSDMPSGFLGEGKKDEDPDVAGTPEGVSMFTHCMLTSCKQAIISQAGDDHSGKTEIAPAASAHNGKHEADIARAGALHAVPCAWCPDGCMVKGTCQYVDKPGGLPLTETKCVNLAIQGHWCKKAEDNECASCSGGCLEDGKCKQQFDSGKKEQVTQEYCRKRKGRWCSQDASDEDCGKCLNGCLLGDECAKDMPRLEPASEEKCVDDKGGRWCKKALCKTCQNGCIINNACQEADPEGKKWTEDKCRKYTTLLPTGVVERARWCPKVTLEEWRRQKKTCTKEALDAAEKGGAVAVARAAGLQGVNADEGVSPVEAKADQDPSADMFGKTEAVCISHVCKNLLFGSTGKDDLYEGIKAKCRSEAELAGAASLQIKSGPVDEWTSGPLFVLLPRSCAQDAIGHAQFPAAHRQSTFAAFL